MSYKPLYTLNFDKVFSPFKIITLREASLATSAVQRTSIQWITIVRSSLQYASAGVTPLAMIKSKMDITQYLKVK